MFIDIRELKRDKLVFAQEFPPGRIDLGKDASQTETLVAEGLAELIEAEIRLQGRLRTTVEVPIAVALVNGVVVPSTPGPELYPIKVLLEPVVLAFAGIAVYPARFPRAVLLCMVVVKLPAFSPTKVLSVP